MPKKSNKKSNKKAKNDITRFHLDNLKAYIERREKREGVKIGIHKKPYATNQGIRAQIQISMPDSTSFVDNMFFHFEVGRWRKS